LLHQQSPSSHVIEILSHDPKCFIVHNFLSSEECHAYISKLNEIRQQQEERIKQSNAPQVSLQWEKLWPLPFLCLGAGIPPLVRLLLLDGSELSLLQPLDAVEWNRIVSVALPPVLFAFGATGLLMIFVTILVQTMANQSARTSESVALNMPQDCDFIRNLVTRASEITHQPWRNWEAPVLTRYSTGALFASHNDASPTRGSEWAELGGQRIVTVIVYLNTCERGGATKFDLLNFQVQPKEGSALVFFPADATSFQADGRTVHQSVSCCWIIGSTMIYMYL
jgi:hypothetical protein